MRVLILGKGFLGSAIHSYLNYQDNMEANIFSKKELDYSNYKVLFNTLVGLTSQSNYDLVINAIGYTGIPNIDAAEDNKESCYNCNVILPIKINNVCKQANVPMIHLSSGCVYNGYDKHYTELDIPNFGIFNEESSFYSKTKHEAEMMLSLTNYSWMFRLRMPYCGLEHPRNYLTKILSYDNLINMQNSMTGVGDFCKFLGLFINSGMSHPYGIYNVVNEGHIEAKEIVGMMYEYGLKNPYHRFIPTNQLRTKAKRSNCILSTDKIKKIGLQLPDIKESIMVAIKRLANRSL
jgi:UDP-glucose 4,6-dehydratase